MVLKSFITAFVVIFLMFSCKSNKSEQKTENSVQEQKIENPVSSYQDVELPTDGSYGMYSNRKDGEFFRTYYDKEGNTIGYFFKGPKDEKFVKLEKVEQKDPAKMVYTNLKTQETLHFEGDLATANLLKINNDGSKSTFVMEHACSNGEKTLFAAFPDYKPPFYYSENPQDPGKEIKVFGDANQLNTGVNIEMPDGSKGKLSLTFDGEMGPMPKFTLDVNGKKTIFK